MLAFLPEETYEQNFREAAARTGLMVLQIKTLKHYRVMATITIEVSDINNAADACREVAEKIEEGYTNGLVGWSSDSWSIDE